MFKDALTAINNAKKITLISHTIPDGDALGSSLALYIVLKKMGKNVKIFNASKPLAQRYEFLPSFRKITATFPENCDLLIAFDCGSFDRLGIEKSDISIINIDHHQSNTCYGDINIIDADKASTSMLLFSLLQSWDIMIDRDIATCIYTALVEDTHFFTTSRVDAQLFRDSSRLIEAGANPSQIAQALTHNDSLAKLRLNALFIDTLHLYHDGSIALGEVTSAMFQKSGALRYDTVSFVEQLLHLATVQLAIFVLELPDGNYKFSLRSKHIDVSIIASNFAGGGHFYAAGFSCQKEEKETVLQQIIDEVKS